MAQDKDEHRKVVFVNVDALVVRKARYYLDEEGLNMAEFIRNTLAQYVAEKEALQPVP